MNTENSNSPEEEPKPDHPESIPQQPESAPPSPDSESKPEPESQPKPDEEAQPAPESEPKPDAAPPPAQPEAPKPVVPPKPTPPPPKPVTPQQVQASQNVVKQPIARSTDGPASEGGEMDRRSFIQWAALGWVAFAAVVGGYTAMFTRFLFPNVLFEPKQSFRAGKPDDYPIGEVSERWKEKHAVWIVRDSEKVYALSTVCTHLGCTPNWLGNEAKFKCPCHGSGFYKTGINFEGPAPRPLERFKVSLTDDGEILVDKTKKFQQEKGEWSDPESFLVV